MRKWLAPLAATPVAMLVLAVFAPQVLAFPYKAEVDGQVVWSELPASREDLSRVLGRSRALLARTPLATGDEAQHIFLTDGGWRWRVLSLSASGGFALTRPLTDPVIIINRSDVADDRVWNGAGVGGERSLSGVIAHESTHALIRDRYGLVSATLAPQWLVEGYCDHVAQETSLSAEEAAQLEADGIAHPALPYFHGRARVEDLLDGNEAGVDALFRNADRD